jgi:lactate dehydrogenase-like 2-hydroxyacid dehydrogenase
MTEPGNRPAIVVTRRLPAAVERRLGTLFHVQLNAEDRPLSSTELSAALGAADGLLCTVSDRLTAEVLGAGGRTRIIANFGVGYNHIDLAAARRAGIVVTNTPDVLTDATADLAMALMLMVARRLGEGERELRSGQWTGWRPTHMLASDVSGRTLGIIGLGRIGKAVARRAHAGFGMKVVSYAPRRVSDAEADSLGVEQLATQEALLERSDFVSLHCRATAETRHLMNQETFRLMKPGAFLINTARGDVVDQRALIGALEKGIIAGAGLDVYEGEPAVPAELIRMNNVVLLPHLGSATLSTRIAMGMKAVDNLESFFDRGTVLDPVT